MKEIAISKKLLRAAKNHINLHPEHLTRDVNFASFKPSYSTREHELAKHFYIVFCAIVYLAKVILLRPTDILMIGDLSCFAQLINNEINFVPHLYPELISD